MLLANAELTGTNLPGANLTNASLAHRDRRCEPPTHHLVKHDLAPAAQTAAPTAEPAPTTCSRNSQQRNTRAEEGPALRRARAAALDPFLPAIRTCPCVEKLRTNANGTERLQGLGEPRLQAQRHEGLRRERPWPHRAPGGASRCLTVEALAARHPPRRLRRAARRDLPRRVRLPLQPAPVERARPALLSVPPEHGGGVKDER